MIEARFVPLERWIGKRCINRRFSRFDSSWGKTLDLLEAELRHLRARDITIEIDLEPRDIRNDGWPRSSASPRTPAVIVSCETSHGRMALPCDRYLDWKDNIRAIALSLQALRAVDRYGVTQLAEQYRGWTQIAPSSNDDDPVAVIARFAGLAMDAARRDLRAAFRAAARKVHPDHGGSTVDFVKLQRAFEDVQSKGLC